MARRTIFGPDMGISGWTPIDDDDDLPLATRPVVAKDLVLPKNNGNAYVDIGNGMYASARGRAHPTSADNRQVETRYFRVPAIEFSSFGNIDTGNAVSEGNRVVYPGWQPREDGIGGRYTYARRQLGDFGTADFLNGEASAGGRSNFSRTEKGDLTGFDVGGDARIGGNLLTIDGSSGPQSWGELNGSMKVLNGEAYGNVFARGGSGVSGRPGAGASATAQADMFSGDVQGKVKVPFTYLNNRLRALDMLFGGNKGPREDVDLVFEGGANGGFGAKAGCDIDGKTFTSWKKLKDACYFQPWFFGDLDVAAYLSRRNDRR